MDGVPCIRAKTTPTHSFIADLARIALTQLCRIQYLCKFSTFLGEQTQWTRQVSIFFLQKGQILCVFLSFHSMLLWDFKNCKKNILQMDPLLSLGSLQVHTSSPPFLPLIECDVWCVDNFPPYYCFVPQARGEFGPLCPTIPCHTIPCHTIPCQTIPYHMCSIPC